LSVAPSLNNPNDLLLGLFETIHPNMPQNPSHPLRGQHPSNSPFEQVDGSHLSRGPLVENGVGVAGKKTNP